MGQPFEVIEYTAPRKAIETDVDFDILSFASRNLAQGIAVALCTLVDIRGGSSKALGAHMAVRADGFYCGYVSGGCTEAAIATEAVQALANRTDRFVMMGEGSPFFDIVLPCGGGITVAIHVLRDHVPLDQALADLSARRSVGLSYNPREQSLHLKRTQESIGWTGDFFSTSYRPRPRLLISGRSVETSATAKVAEAAGYDVVCHRPEPHKSIDQGIIDQYTAIALLHHDLDMEAPMLRAALESQPFYIGALGSSRTHEKRIERLRQQGFASKEIARIKAPIGLFGKARDSGTLALSVLAEVAVQWQALASVKVN